MSQPSDYQPPYPIAAEITEEMSVESFQDFLEGREGAFEICFLMQGNNRWCESGSSSMNRDNAKVWNLESLSVQEEWSDPKRFHILPPLGPVQAAVVEPPASGDETPGQIMFRALSQNRQSSQLDPAKAIQQRVQHLTEKVKALLASNSVLHHLPLLVAVEGHYFTDKLLTTAEDWVVIHRLNEAVGVRYNATTKQPQNPFNNLVRAHVQGLIGTQDQKEKPF